MRQRCWTAHLRVALPRSEPGEPPEQGTGRGQHSATVLREEVGQDTACLSPETPVRPVGGGERAGMLRWKGLKKANRLRMKKLQERKWCDERGEVKRRRCGFLERGLRTYVKRAVRKYGHRVERQEKGLSREAGGKESDKMKPRQHAHLERMKTSRNYW